MALVMYLKGSSIIEVIVSTIIILCCFLFFSSFIGKLYEASSVVPATKLLFSIHYDPNLDFDTTDLHSYCPKCILNVTATVEDSISVQTIFLTNGSTIEPIISLHRIGLQ